MAWVFHTETHRSYSKLYRCIIIIHLNCSVIWDNPMFLHCTGSRTLSTLLLDRAVSAARCNMSVWTLKFFASPVSSPNNRTHAQPHGSRANVCWKNTSAENFHRNIADRPRSACSIFTILFDWFQSDLEAEGFFYPKVEYAVRTQRMVQPRMPFPCDLANGR